jgi:Holliday junction DNA helicase RuvB
LPQFTLVGATTKAGSLSGPLRDRFGVIHRLDFYSQQEVSKILEEAAKKLQVEIDKESLSEIAKRSRFTPRVALRLLKRVRDMAQVKNRGIITKIITDKTLSMLEVDEKGLDFLDRKYLMAIIQMYRGGPVGLETIAASLSEDTGTLEEVVEPYLLQIGLLQKSPRGRMVADGAYAHLKIPDNRIKK